MILYEALAKVQTGRRLFLMLYSLLPSSHSLLLLMLAHNCLSFSGAVNWFQPLTSAGHIYPIAKRHTFHCWPIVLLLSFQIWSSPAFRSFMLLFCTCPPTPHHRPAFADSLASPPSSFHQPVSEESSATSTTSVGIRLADARGRCPSITKSPFRGEAQKTLWQDSLSRIICCNNLFFFFLIFIH